MKMSPVDAGNRTFGDEEPVTIAMQIEAADGKFAAAGGDDVLAALKLDEVAARGQAVQGGFQLGRGFRPWRPIREPVA